MSPIAGFTRLRAHQFGRQAALGTPIEASRRYPFSGTPDRNLNWTDQEIDAGSIDTVAKPTRGAPDLTAALTAPALDYNTLTAILCGFFGGQVDPTGGGTAKTWTHQPPSTTVDDLDYFTHEFGDDVLTDWDQLSDGIVESFEVSGPEGLGPLTASVTWRYGDYASTGSTDSPVTGTVPTPDLDLDTDPPIIYLKDAGIYIADSTAGLAAGQVMDALHSFTLRGSGDVDQKRFANATQSFRVSALARASRLIEFEGVFAKTDDIVGTGSEVDDWTSDEAVDRYLRMVFISTKLAQGPATFYGWTFTLPLRYYTRTDGDSGGNSTVVLTGRGFYDGTAPIFNSVLINTLASDDLGPVGS